MNLIKKLDLSAFLAAGLFLAPACATDDGDIDGDDGDACAGAKCDTPSGDQAQQCKDRQSEVLSSSNAAFTKDAIRWACADVEGVNAVGGDSRGQEYCEYFALFQPPALEEGSDERPPSVDLGRPLDRTGQVSNLTICVDQDGDGADDDGRTAKECRVTLNEEQFIYLEEHSTEVLGQCVFTSWHADVDFPVANCRAEDGSEKCGDEAQVMGFPFTIENFQMKISFNSNRAAADLVEKCFDPDSPKDIAPKDWSDKEDPLTEPFFRGCMEVQNHFGTGWRRSDPSVCAVANRLRECGCAAPGVTNAVELGDAVVPPQTDPNNITLRGFQLGTWDNSLGLPAGCRFAETGEPGNRFLVLCDLTANDIFGALNDPKEVCRATYGNQVVVHVPLPAEAITCNPDAKAPEAEGCGAIPWMIGNEGTATDPPEEPEAPVEPEDPDLGAPGNCCEAATDSRTGCENAGIQACVCAKDDWCCANGWDKQCAGEVESFACAQC